MPGSLDVTMQPPKGWGVGVWGDWTNGVVAADDEDCLPLTAPTVLRYSQCRSLMARGD